MEHYKLLANNNMSIENNTKIDMNDRYGFYDFIDNLSLNVELFDTIKNMKRVIAYVVMDPYIKIYDNNNQTMILQKLSRSTLHSLLNKSVNIIVDETKQYKTTLKEIHVGNLSEFMYDDIIFLASECNDNIIQLHNKPKFIPGPIHWSGHQDVKFILDHIFHVICDSKSYKMAYIMKWLHAVIIKNVKAPTNLYIYSRTQDSDIYYLFQGFITKIIGRKYCSCDIISRLFRGYNEVSNDKLYSTIELGQNNYSDKLKHVLKMLTKGNITIHAKCKKRVFKRHYTNYVLTGDYKINFPPDEPNQMLSCFEVKCHPNTKNGDDESKYRTTLNRICNSEDPTSFNEVAYAFTEMLNVCADGIFPYYTSQQYESANLLRQVDDNIIDDKIKEHDSDIIIKTNNEVDVQVKNNCSEYPIANCIYLLLVPASIDNKLYWLVKGGRTGNMKKRIKDYPIGTTVIHVVKVKNMRMAEDLLLKYISMIADKHAWTKQKREYWHAGYTEITQWNVYLNIIIEYMNMLQ